MLLCQQTHKTFAQRLTVCTKQDLGREHGMLSSVCTQSLYTVSVMMLVTLSKMVVLLQRAWHESQWTVSVLVRCLTVSMPVWVPGL